MKTRSMGLCFGLAIAAAFAQSAADTPDSHRAAARAAAGKDLLGLYNRVCADTGAPAPQAAGRGVAAAPAARPVRRLRTNGTPSP